MKRTIPKTAAAYWLSKVKKPSGSNLYGVQIAHRGQRHRFPLETSNREAAAEKARGIYLSLAANGMETTLEIRKPRTAKKIQTATIGAWVEAVKATAEFRPSTLANYAQCLRQIAADIEDIQDQPLLDENGQPKRDKKRRPILQSRFDYKTGGRDAWASKVNEVSLSIFTAAAVQRWKVDYIAKAGDAQDARRRAENSAASIMRCARSLFSTKARKYAAEEMVLPNPLPFSDVDLPKRGNTTYQSRIDAGELIAAARKELTGQPLQIFILGICCGLRRREIDLLTWKQVDFEKGVIRIERTEYFQPKSEDSIASVDLDPETVAVMREWKAVGSGPFVIVSSRKPRHTVNRVNYRCTPYFEALNAWLKGKGITAQKPLHELRKELGAILASSQGIFAAQAVLRHAQISTTAAYYTDKKKRITAGLGSLLVNAPAEPPP
ncbi:MAG: hypothetical protein JWM59_2943 [Verrucomicrobiales bacterium]|nr:hypothetical protein [Verrucomicrobiales bacterium]